MTKEKDLLIEVFGGLTEYVRIKTYLSARPKGLREKVETAISCSEPGPTRNKKRYTSSREEDDVATNMCPCGTAIE